MKRHLTFLVIVAFIFCSISIGAFASTNKPLKNLGQGLDDILYGQLEVPDNANETGTKGSPAYADCTDKTNDDVGRGIARFVGGLWRIATFWYPEEDTATEMTMK
ncbi:MAG: hypothetical protein WBD24_02230 [Candidatus Omnitrophota bacterium]